MLTPYPSLPGLKLAMHPETDFGCSCLYPAVCMPVILALGQLEPGQSELHETLLPNIKGKRKAKLINRSHQLYGQESGKGEPGYSRKKGQFHRELKARIIIF